MFAIQLDAKLDSNELEFGSTITKSEAYDDQLSIMDIELNTSNEIPELAVYQNEPNPWTSKTTIRYSLDKEQEVIFYFRSSEGKLLKKIQVEGSIGENTLPVDAIELGAGSGVIYYEMQTATERIIKKMILVH